MKRISLDTNAISHLFRGDKEVMKVMNEADIIYLPYFVIAELHAGFAGGNRKEKNLSILTALEQKSKVRRIYPTDHTIEIYVEIYRHLREKGKPIPTHDIWIAAMTIENSAVLITYDHHFKEV